MNFSKRICFIFPRYNFSRLIILTESLKVRVKELKMRLAQSNGNSHVSGQFEWVDGQLVKALKNGHWLLIDNVNFCRCVTFGLRWISILMKKY
jgi:midasin (ATPase involved in ribosome maturation)